MMRTSSLSAMNRLTPRRIGVIFPAPRRCADSPLRCPTHPTNWMRTPTSNPSWRKLTGWSRGTDVADSMVHLKVAKPIRRPQGANKLAEDFARCTAAGSSPSRDHQVDAFSGCPGYSWVVSFDDWGSCAVDRHGGSLPSTTTSRRSWTLTRPLTAEPARLQALLNPRGLWASAAAIVAVV